MKKIYLSPKVVIVNLNTSCSIAETSTISVDTETVITGPIDEEDKLVKKSLWDDEW